MKSPKDSLKISRFLHEVKGIYVLLKGERFFGILVITFATILLGALAVFLADKYFGEKGIGGFFNAVWWAVVTITTVGYGDIVPTSTLGKIAGLVIILSGPALLSLITASVASTFVEKKIKEGKGLEAIKDKDHVIVCGWNRSAENLIDGILAQEKKGQAIVLVNELDRDDVQSIQYKYKDHKLNFVRGNFVKEDILARANLVRAKAAIVLADTSGGHSIERADQRTIFGTMTIKSMAPKVRTCAELIDPDNREHLIRANVDEVIVRGQSAGSLLAKTAISPGVSDAMMLLISDEDENKLWRIRVPARFAGRAFGDLASHLREKTGALVLAILKEKQRMKLEDILSSDSSAIDAFIKRKFLESGKDLFGSRKDISVLINPPDEQELSPNDWILVISKERP
ncbi:MAG: hypothetical protein GY849_19280 [Deltaproteobacteria bacterium]|nr:hypothetical protein [Deltaproteobacteria bacterium]